MPQCQAFPTYEQVPLEVGRRLDLRCVLEQYHKAFSKDSLHNFGGLGPYTPFSREAGLKLELDLVGMTLRAEQAEAEVRELQGARLVAAVFGHSGSAPKSFALVKQGPPVRQAALGSEFPGGHVALWLADGGWVTHMNTGAEAVAQTAGLKVLWLSEELEPLSEMEQRAEKAEAELAAIKAERGQVWESVLNMYRLLTMGQRPTTKESKDETA